MPNERPAELQTFQLSTCNVLLFASLRKRPTYATMNVPPAGGWKGQFVRTMTCNKEGVP
jgi:hypothetical protein